MNRYKDRAPLFAWCPTCGGPRPCDIQQGTTDWQVDPAYVCHDCGHVTHDPVVRLTPPPRPNLGRAPG
jgi:uncharacterized Zn finger protein